MWECKLPDLPCPADLRCNNGYCDCPEGQYISIQKCMDKKGMHFFGKIIFYKNNIFYNNNNIFLFSVVGAHCIVGVQCLSGVCEHQACKGWTLTQTSGIIAAIVICLLVIGVITLVVLQRRTLRYSPHRVEEEDESYFIPRQDHRFRMENPAESPPDGMEEIPLR